MKRFLGFANFYRRFIRNFSLVAAPLTALTSPKVPFRWNSQAQEAFDFLKSHFLSAPVLCLPDPEQQFIVEVDASEVGVGAVLSQRSPRDEKLHPCAFFSHRLSPAERNYVIGNRELLAVRLALGEWRHWLEGAARPFLVWTDHKNLEYIRSAKRLNARQARWALFFGRFNFSVVVDHFSKVAHFVPLPKLPSVKEIAQVVVDHIFRIHGLSVDVVSDRGPQFASLFWKEFCRQIGASTSLSKGFNPQTNGQSERANQDLERTLRCLSSHSPSSWSQQLPCVEYSLPVASTGMSPFQCSMGY